MSKIKLVAPGWETFTGDFCMVMFQDGTSVEPVSRMLIDRISSLVLTALVDDAGETQGQAGAAARYVNAQAIPMEVADPLATMTPEQLAAERQAAMDAALKNPASVIYTQEQLEVIGGTEGLKGVRSIGDKWGVKERSIAKLIELILTAQAEYQARVGDREAEAAKQREAATAETLKIQADKQAAIDAQARNLTVEAESKATANAQKAHEAAVAPVPGTIPVSQVPANEWANIEAKLENAVETAVEAAKEAQNELAQLKAKTDGAPQ